MKKRWLSLILILSCLVAAAFNACADNKLPEPETTAATEITTTTTAATTTTESTTTALTTTETTAPTTTTARSSEPLMSGRTTTIADGVTITAQRDTYPTGTTHIPVNWRNDGKETILFGDSFTLQVWDGGAWAEAEPLGRMVFLTIGYLLAPGESREHTYPVEEYYGSLPPGRYRIAAHYIYDKDRPINKYYIFPMVYAEFAIK